MAQTTNFRLLFKKRTPETKPPKLASPLAAGYDLTSDEEEFTIQPGEIKKVNTGIAVALPENIVGQLHVRSSTGIKLRINLVNQEGIIDPDYRGWIYATIINSGELPQTIHRGQRLFQLILSEIQRGHLEEVEELPQTERGTGETGSTGKF